jgi:hypothetical protein
VLFDGAQGGALPSGHAGGQLPFLSGVEPLSQLDCPRPEPVPVFGVEGGEEGEGENEGFPGMDGICEGDCPGIAGIVVFCPSIAGIVVFCPSFAGIVVFLYSVGETVCGFDGEMVGAMVCGCAVLVGSGVGFAIADWTAVEATGDVGVPTRAGGGVTICVLLCCIFEATATFWLFITFMF